jgi:putative SOS response-associated peptidase YedK
MARHEPRYTLTTLDGLFVEASVTVRYNIAPGQLAAVVRGVRTPDGSGAGSGGMSRDLAYLRWGLLPRWRGHGGTRGPMIHAVPLEAVPATPLLRNAFRHQRCLILADGCYAWNALKQPVWFHPEPPRVIAFAGLWAVNDDDGVESFAMITGEPLVTRVTEAMPVVIAEADYERWLDPRASSEAATPLCAPRPLAGWRADIVSTWMSSVTHDDPRCIEPVGNPRQGELF